MQLKSVYIYCWYSAEIYWHDWRQCCITHWERVKEDLKIDVRIANAVRRIDATRQIRKKGGCCFTAFCVHVTNLVYSTCTASYKSIPPPHDTLYSYTRRCLCVSRDHNSNKRRRGQQPEGALAAVWRWRTTGWIVKEMRLLYTCIYTYTFSIFFPTFLDMIYNRQSPSQGFLSRQTLSGTSKAFFSFKKIKARPWFASERAAPATWAREKRCWHKLQSYFPFGGCCVVGKPSSVVRVYWRVFVRLSRRLINTSTKAPQGEMTSCGLDCQS